MRELKAAHYETIRIQSVLRTCGARSPGAVSIVMTLSATGKIMDVMATPWTPRSQCFVRHLAGMNMPTPPKAPFYLKTDVAN